MRLGCVISASGVGERFVASGGTGNKLLADCAGMPLIARTMLSVPLSVFEVVVVARHGQVADAVRTVAPSVQVVAPESQEHSSSIRAGLRAGAKHWDGCLFLPGDQPLVSSESFKALVQVFETDPSCIYRLCWKDRTASPVLFPQAAFNALDRIAGEAGGAEVIASNGFCVKCVEALSEYELLDVDTLDDFKRIASYVSCDTSQMFSHTQ